MGKTVEAESIDYFPNDKVSLLTKISYSVGVTGKDCMTLVINTYLFMFYTNIFGLSPMTIGTLFLAARIWDAINDPIFGNVIDKTMTRFGKYRTYYLIIPIPIAIVFTLIFFVPGFGMTGKIIYAAVTYVLYGMLFTFLDVAYMGAVPTFTRDPKERNSIMAWSKTLGKLPQLFVPTLLTVCLAKFGASNGYIALGVILGIIVIATSFFAFFGCEERHLPSAKEKEKISIKEFWAILVGNKALLIIMIMQILVNFTTIVGDMLNMHYITYYLNRMDLQAVFVAFVGIGGAIGQLLSPWMISKFGSAKRAMYIGFAGYLVCAIGCYLIGNRSIVGLLAIFFILCLWQGYLMISVISMILDTCDYVEYKTGKRSDGTIMALVSFGIKLAAGFAATLAGAVLTIAGFVQGADEQAASVGTALNFWRFAGPSVLIIVAAIVLLFYPLGKDRVAEIRLALGEKHVKEWTGENKDNEGE